MIPVIFINCSDQPYVDAIMNGTKTYETRTRNTLKTLLSWALGERVLIAETGHGAPVVRCSAVIDHFGAVCTKDRWNDLRKVPAYRLEVSTIGNRTPGSNGCTTCPLFVQSLRSHRKVNGTGAFGWSATTHRKIFKVCYYILY